MSAIATDTHVGTEPELDDEDDAQVCHLLGDDHAPLCGVARRAWGIHAAGPDPLASPCSCGRERCPDCAAAL